MTAATPDFRRGGEGSKEASKNNSGSKFYRPDFFKLAKDGDQTVIRYITDDPEWIYVAQHQSVPTKNKPADYEGNWPAEMGAVCRNDPAFKSLGYDDCYICNAGLKNKWGKTITSSVRNWALGVLREEVIGTEDLVAKGICTPEQVGRRLGYTDKTVEVTLTDEKGEEIGKKQIPHFVIINQPFSIFFAGLHSMYEVYQTVCDRDYVVKRSGDGKETVYTNTPLDRTENLLPGTPRWKEKYLDPMEEFGISLMKIVMDRSSDDFYARFFDPSKTPSSGAGSQAAAASTSGPVPPPAGSNEVDLARLEEMRARIRGGSTVAVSGSEID